MHQYETRNKARLASAAALALLVGASVIACSGGGSSSPAVPLPVPVPVPGPIPVVIGAWLSYGGDAQHTATSSVRTQDLARIVWQAPVDIAPTYSAAGYLLVHYGSPVITAKNTVIFPVKRSVADAYRVEARIGGNWRPCLDHRQRLCTADPPVDAALQRHPDQGKPGGDGRGRRQGVLPRRRRFGGFGHQ